MAPGFYGTPLVGLVGGFSSKYGHFWLQKQDGDTHDAKSRLQNGTEPISLLW